MLLAATSELESSLRVRMLRVRERELDYFLSNAYNVGNLAALLAGFAQSGLVYTKYIDNDLCGPRELLCSEILYPVSIALAIGFAISTVWGSMLLTTHAPRTAIHGADSEVYQRCVDRLEKEFHGVLQQLACAVAAFCCSAALWAFSKYGSGKTVNAKPSLQLLHSTASSHVAQRAVVRYLGIVFLIGLIIVGGLWLMMAINAYLSRRVFHIRGSELVRGTFGGSRRSRRARRAPRSHSLAAEPVDKFSADWGIDQLFNWHAGEEYRRRYQRLKPEAL